MFQKLMRKRPQIGMGPQKYAVKKVIREILRNQGFVRDTVRKLWMDFEQFKKH